MTLLQGQFTDACRILLDAWQQSPSVEDVKNDWQNAEIKHDTLGLDYLRVTRTLRLRTQESTLISETDHELIEDDPEAVTRAANQEIRICYDLVYSPSYQVPVIYLSLQRNHNLSLDELYSALVPDIHGQQLRQTGEQYLFGGLSLTDHPVTNMPAYFVHPCRTAEAMDMFNGKEENDAVKWLLRYIGLIGASVGLNVPVHVVEKIQKGRD